MQTLCKLTANQISLDINASPLLTPPSFRSSCGLHHCFPGLLCVRWWMSSWWRWQGCHWHLPQTQPQGRCCVPDAAGSRRAASTGAVWQSTGWDPRTRRLGPPAHSQTLPQGGSPYTWGLCWGGSSGQEEKRGKEWRIIRIYAWFCILPLEAMPK